MANFQDPSIDVEYQKLRDLITANKWKKADKQTTYLILKSIGKDRKGSMDINDVQKIPIELIREIDTAWNTLSGNQFGISVQKEIYSKLDGTGKFDKEFWSKYARSVGWLGSFSSHYSPKCRGNLPYDYLTVVEYQKYFTEICQTAFVCIVAVILILLLNILILFILQPLFYPFRSYFSKKMWRPWYAFAQHLGN